LTFIHCFWVSCT